MYHINISSEELRKLQQQSVLMGLGDDVKQKLEWFLFYLESGKSVSHTCANFGIARSTFYRWVQRFDPQDLRTLEEQSHRPRILRQTKVTQTLINLVRIYRMQNPYLGKEQIAELLEAEHNIVVSPSTIGRIITQENLYFGGSLLHQKRRNDTVASATQSSPGTESINDSFDVSADTDFAQSADGENEFELFASAWRALVRCVWRKFRRPVIITSLLINIVFIGMLLMTAAWESSVSERRSAQAVIQLTTEGRAAAPVNGARQAAASDTPQIETNTVIHE